MAVGAGISGEILMIVAEKITMKTFSQRASRTGATSFGLREDMSSGRDNLSAIGESNVSCCILRDGEGMVLFISVTFIRGGRIYCSGRGGSH